ncbi:uncharacterized protein LOC106704471 [Latimeria chalumnae]|uniref:uncharacterized protein LOC106704471 n=1 Tax=Latimeria chalumnae TaxID=7897 RepID=UPI0006D93AD6|nr:PREDICTED: uncharacterized protein LOC106704471 [Latimeria chalumnae]|eukprot:XP_014347055.1 PREDICTED: uncharacterized protein LOC106704471 [Latimeria chalumnae]
MGSSSARYWVPLLTVLSAGLILILTPSPSDAALHHHEGKCKHKDKLFKPGQTFMRGCDKCYCHDEGFVCFTPMKPTSWPKKCKRISVECGYQIVYRHKPEAECRAYSWIG